jgi:uncharacterized protein YdaU (DUF1376 family)
MSVPKREVSPPAAVSFLGELEHETNMHYYKFNIADYRKDTGHLSTIEHGIYRQLIDWYYLDEQPIPEETQMVIRRLRLGSDEVMFLQNVLSDFFVLGKKGYEHKRIEVEIKDYHEQVEKNKNNGKLGGRPKKTQSVISGLPDESQNNPNQEPLTINHKPIEKNKRGSRLPQDWFLTKSMGDWATQERPDLDVRQIAEQFKDYWVAQAGQKGVKLDWDATWRNWVRNTKAVKQNPYDVGRLTVASKNEPDPALEKIKADEKTTRPPTPEELAIFNSIRRKA